MYAASGDCVVVNHEWCISFLSSTQLNFHFQFLFIEEESLVEDI